MSGEARRPVLSSNSEEMGGELNGDIEAEVVTGHPRVWPGGDHEVGFVTGHPRVWPAKEEEAQDDDEKGRCQQEQFAARRRSIYFGKRRKGKLSEDKKSMQEEEREPNHFRCRGVMWHLHDRHTASVSFSAMNEVTQVGSMTLIKAIDEEPRKIQRQRRARRTRRLERDLRDAQRQGKRAEVQRLIRLIACRSRGTRRRFLRTLPSWQPTVAELKAHVAKAGGDGGMDAIFVDPIEEEKSLRRPTSSTTCRSTI